MGLDANLFISNKWSVRNIQEILKNHLDIEEQKLNFHEFEPNYVTVSFTYKNEDRGLHIHINATRAGFMGVLLSLRAWGNSEEILRGIAKVTGGFFAMEDCSGTYEEIEDPEDGNLRFLVDLALIENKDDKIDKARKILNFRKK